MFLCMVLFLWMEVLRGLSIQSKAWTSSKKFFMFDIILWFCYEHRHSSLDKNRLWAKITWFSISISICVQHSMMPNVRAVGRSIDRSDGREKWRIKAFPFSVAQHALFYYWSIHKHCAVSVCNPVYEALNMLYTILKTYTNSLAHSNGQI